MQIEANEAALAAAQRRPHARKLLAGASSGRVCSYERWGSRCFVNSRTAQSRKGSQWVSREQFAPSPASSCCAASIHAVYRRRIAGRGCSIEPHRGSASRPEVLGRKLAAAALSRS